jgi:hypothetical protein
LSFDCAQERSFENGCTARGWRINLNNTSEILVVTAKIDRRTRLAETCASEIVREKTQELENFFQLNTSRNWADLSPIQKFDGASNAALFYAVQFTSGISVLAVSSPVELHKSASLLDVVVLDESEVAVIKTLLITFKSL